MARSEISRVGKRRLAFVEGLEPASYLDDYDNLVRKPLAAKVDRDLFAAMFDTMWESDMGPPTTVLDMVVYAILGRRVVDL